jgi:HSP20 family protein
MANKHDLPVQRSHARESHRQRSHEQSYSPFALMRQGLDEMDRWWNRLAERGWPSASAQGRNWMSQLQQMGDWAPPIEAFQRGNEFVVRAEVPGMTRTDLNVEVGDDSLTVRGERKHEQHEESEGMFWTERSYGSFCRVVPLPPGTITDSAKASFSNGVLEVVMQTPPQEARRGRKVDISGV